MTMQRYKVFPTVRGALATDEGKWVKADEAEERIAKAEERIDELKEQLETALASKKFWRTRFIDLLERQVK